jgi:hypothetical protein
MTRRLHANPLAATMLTNWSACPSGLDEEPIDERQ